MWGAKVSNVAVENGNGRKRHSECLPLSVWCWLWSNASQLPISRQLHELDHPEDQQVESHSEAQYDDCHVIVLRRAGGNGVGRAK